MTSRPDPLTYTYVLDETRKAVGDWWLSQFLDRLVGTMIGFWLIRLTVRTDRWMAQAEAAEKLRNIPQAEPNSKPEQEVAPRPVRSAEAAATIAATRARRRAKLEELAPWKLPPQWTMPCAWPAKPAKACKLREFGWLNRHMKWRAGVYTGMLQALVVTAPMVRLFQNCPAAVQGWIPLCRMFGVDTNLVRHAGRPVPKPRSRPRTRLTPREKWLRALARDPKPKVRMVERKSHDGPHGSRGIMQLKPRGNVYMNIDDPADQLRRTK
jgi:hypothetical protein